MHGERRSYTVITERLRVITRFGDEMELEPSGAGPLHIAEWLGDHRTDWSPGTACTYFGYLKAWFHWLQLTDRRIDNPMLKVGRPRNPDREPRPTSDQALMRLLETSMRHRTRVMIMLAVLAGLRVSEIAQVRGEHVDTTIPAIWVDGKNRKARTVPLHPLLVDAAATMPTRGFWFPANSMRPGEHVLGKSVSHVISLAMCRAGIASTPHKLRHWFGTTLLDDGADIRTVQELLRHSSLTATQVYTKIPDQRRHEAIRRLDPFRASKDGHCPN
jgi:site-specific recombinase XerD